MNELYEAYKLLDHNGFTPTDENVALLDEGLASGEIVLLDGSAAVLTEATGDDYYRHLLDQNGYTMTDRNVNILKEGLESGKFIVVTNEFLTEDHPGVKAAVKTAGTGAAVVGSGVAGARGAIHAARALKNASGFGRDFSSAKAAGIVGGAGGAIGAGIATAAAIAAHRAKKKAEGNKAKQTEAAQKQKSAPKKNESKQKPAQKKNNEATIENKKNKNTATV